MNVKSNAPCPRFNHDDCTPGVLAELSGIGCIPRSQGRQRLSTALILPPVPDNCGEKSVENTRDAEEGRECVQNRCLGRE